jgi:hypothetical protein
MALQKGFNYSSGIYLGLVGIVFNGYSHGGKQSVIFNVVFITFR